MCVAHQINDAHTQVRANARGLYRRLQGQRSRAVARPVALAVGLVVTDGVTIAIKIRPYPAFQVFERPGLKAINIEQQGGGKAQLLPGLQHRNRLQSPCFPDAVVALEGPGCRALRRGKAQADRDSEIEEGRGQGRRDRQFDHQVVEVCRAAVADRRFGLQLDDRLTAVGLQRAGQNGEGGQAAKGNGHGIVAFLAIPIGIDPPGRARICRVTDHRIQAPITVQIETGEGGRTVQDGAIGDIRIEAEGHARAQPQAFAGQKGRLTAGKALHPVQADKARRQAGGGEALGLGLNRNLVHVENLDNGGVLGEQVGQRQILQRQAAGVLQCEFKVQVIVIGLSRGGQRRRLQGHSLDQPQTRQGRRVVGRITIPILVTLRAIDIIVRGPLNPLPPKLTGHHGPEAQGAEAGN